MGFLCAVLTFFGLGCCISATADMIDNNPPRRRVYIKRVYVPMNDNNPIVIGQKMEETVPIAVAEIVNE